MAIAHLNGSTVPSTTDFLRTNGMPAGQPPQQLSDPAIWFDEWQRGYGTPKRPITTPSTIDLTLDIHGHQVQLSLHDHDDSRLLARLEAILSKYPAPPAPQQTPARVTPPQLPAGDAQQAEVKPWWCEMHRCVMSPKRGKNGDTWYSHQRDTGGWCRGTDKA